MGRRIIPIEKYFISSERGFPAAVSQQDQIEKVTGYPHDIREVCYDENFELKDCDPGDANIVMRAGYMVEPLKIPVNCGIWASYDIMRPNNQTWGSEYGKFGQKAVNFVPAAECSYALYRLGMDSGFVPFPWRTFESTASADDYGVALAPNFDLFLAGMMLLSDLTPWMYRKVNGEYL